VAYSYNAILLCASVYNPKRYVLLGKEAIYQEPVSAVDGAYIAKVGEDGTTMDRTVFLDHHPEFAVLLKIEFHSF